MKKLLLVKAMDNIQPYLQNGYGFTMSEIRDYMYRIDETGDVLIYNRDVKKLLSDHYGNTIQFAPYLHQNESEIVFSSEVTLADLASKMKNIDIIKTAGTSLRQVL